MSKYNEKHFNIYIREACQKGRMPIAAGHPFSTSTTLKEKQTLINWNGYRKGLQN